MSMIAACSICGKTPHQVKKLIAAPTFFICDECVALLLEVLREAGIELVTEAKTDG